MADQPSAELEKLDCKYEPQAEAPDTACFYVGLNYSLI